MGFNSPADGIPKADGEGSAHVRDLRWPCASHASTFALDLYVANIRRHKLNRRVYADQKVLRTIGTFARPSPNAIAR